MSAPAPVSAPPPSLTPGRSYRWKSKVGCWREVTLLTLSTCGRYAGVVLGRCARYGEVFHVKAEELEELPAVKPDTKL